MPIDFVGWVYEPCMEIFGRDVVITPFASQPGALPYGARGIFDTNEIEVVSMEGSIVTDTRTELDILMADFAVLPAQEDVVSIPSDDMLDGGDFLVSNVSDRGNAGGEVTLTLKRVMMPQLVGTDFVVGSPQFAWPKMTHTHTPP